MSSKINFYTRKINSTYCTHYLKNKNMMEDLGIDFDSPMDERIFDNYEFSLLIDHLGKFESLCRKYNVNDWGTLEALLKQNKRNLKGNI